MYWNYHPNGNSVKSYAVNEIRRGRSVLDWQIYTSSQISIVPRWIQRKEKIGSSQFSGQGEVKSFTAKETWRGSADVYLLKRTIELEIDWAVATDYFFYPPTYSACKVGTPNACIAGSLTGPISARAMLVSIAGSVTGPISARACTRKWKIYSPH